MKKLAGILLTLSLVLMLFSSYVWAEETMAPQETMASEETIVPEETMAPVAAEVSEAVAAAPDVLTQASALIEAGGLENCKKALDLCLQEVKKNPGDFRANWMAAQACREYGNEAKKAEVSGWEEICKTQGKAGMNYAEKAKEIDSSKVEGHYWYGMNVGIYSDGVSILTALKEGLKDKTQNSFETAYKIDKTYDKGGPIGALARFWQVLPWPLNDKDKSMVYFREFQKTEFFKDPEAVEAHIYFAELLMDSRNTKAEAKAMLEEAIQMTSEKYWKKQAQALLNDM